MRLSIIIPVYNVEQYLKRCIDSCECQNIPRDDYELIIVDDGSTDNSLQVAHKLTQKYENVIVIHQENRGLSGARNTGMSVAKGNYLWFVDSDDWVVENSVGSVLSLCEMYDLDICHFSSVDYSPDGEIISNKSFPCSNVLMKGRDVLLQYSSQVVRAVWLNFYKREFIDQNSFQFVDRLTQQDVEFNGRVFSVAQRCMFIDEALYVYFYNQDSLSRSTNVVKRIKYVGDTVRVAALHRAFYEENCDDQELRNFMNKHINSRIAGVILNMIRIGEAKPVVDEFVKIAKEKGLYPVVGSFVSRKWNYLRLILNHRSLWWLFKFV